MPIFVLIVYVAVFAVLVGFILGRPWSAGQRRLAVLLAIVTPPGIMLLGLSGKSTEVAGWGAALIVMLVLPANLLAALIGWLWHRRGARGRPQ